MSDVIRILSLHAFMLCTGVNYAVSFVCAVGDRDRVVIIVTRLGAGFVSAPKRPDPLWGPFSCTLNRHKGLFQWG
jgi:hypothetical protein